MRAVKQYKDLNAREKLLVETDPEFIWRLSPVILVRAPTGDELLVDMVITGYPEEACIFVTCNINGWTEAEAKTNYQRVLNAKWNS